MLKPIDLLVGLKILCNPDLSQQELSQKIGCVPSQVSKAIKILLQVELFYVIDKKLLPNYKGWEDILLAIKYFIPIKTVGVSVGMPTAYAAEPISNEIHKGSDPIPVWPYANGKARGIGIQPLHPLITKSLAENPDEKLYEVLVLVDTIRMGRAREKELAKKFISKFIKKIIKAGIIESSNLYRKTIDFK